MEHSAKWLGSCSAKKLRWSMHKTRGPAPVITPSSLGKEQSAPCRFCFSSMSPSINDVKWVWWQPGRWVGHLPTGSSQLTSTLPCTSSRIHLSKAFSSFQLSTEIYRKVQHMAAPSSCSQPRTGLPFAGPLWQQTIIDSTRRLHVPGQYAVCQNRLGISPKELA